MKTPYRPVLLAAMVMASLAGPALAQDAAEDARKAEIAEKERLLAERMREAEQQLAEAAQRVAELSTERLGAVGDAERFVFEFSDRPRLGVTISDEMSDEPAEGVEVIGVTPGSAADDAGIRAGDVITSVNGESMSADSEHDAAMKLLDFMKGVEAGDRLGVEYLRAGKVGNVEVEPRVMRENALAWTGRVPRLQTLPVAPGGFDPMRFALRGWRGAWGDMELVELSADLGRYFGTDKGLLVVSAPSSSAVDLKDGDVITSIDGRAPTSVNHCMRILGSYQPGEAMTLEILRDKRRQTVEIEVPEHRKPH